MVDTGASIVALTFEDAASAGIHVRDPEFTHRVSTANGVARVAMITLDSVAIDDIMVRNVRAAVAERGKLTKTLLGMSFLGQLSRTEMSRGDAGARGIGRARPGSRGHCPRARITRRPAATEYSPFPDLTDHLNGASYTRVSPASAERRE